jgi:tetratricopeptide (TPR) repeat protein
MSQNRLKLSLNLHLGRSSSANFFVASLLWLLMMVFLQPSVDAQEDLFVVFGSVKLEEGNKRMEGVKVLVYQDGNLYDELLTDVKGDYDFELPLRHQYSFRFDLEGHSKKKIDVDASGIPENVKGNRNMDLDMTLFLLPPGFDGSIFDSPYGRGDYDASKNTVVFDNSFTVRMRNRVQAEFGRLERMGEELEQMQENFEDFVKKGNQSAQREEWQKAVDFYDSALAIFPEDEGALSKRLEVQLKLEETLASNASEAAFEAKLNEGRSALNRDDLDAATAAFEEAAEMRPDSPEPSDGLGDVQTRRDELEKDGVYNEILAEADDLFGREQYEKAIKVYDNALRLKPSERYPKERQAEAQTRLDDLASMAASIVERTMAYETLMSEGNKLFRGDDYEAALLKFEEASEILPAEKLPKQRAEASRERIAEAEAEENDRLRREEERAGREAASAALRVLQKQYDAINDEADLLFRNDDYEAAIPKYAEALAVLPEERYPAQRMAEAQKRLDEAAAKAEARKDADSKREKDEETAQREEELNQAEEARIAARKEADRLAEEEERQARENQRSAEAAEKEASRQAAEDESMQRAEAARIERENREAEELAQDEADRMERELRDAEASVEAEEAALLDAEFDSLIKKADKAFNLSDWNAANSSYLEALELKPNDRYASRKLQRITEEQNKIQRSIDAANDEARQEALRMEAALAAEAAAAEELAFDRAQQNQQEEKKSPARGRAFKGRAGV